MSNVIFLTLSDDIIQVSLKSLYKFSRCPKSHTSYDELKLETYVTMLYGKKLCLYVHVRSYVELSQIKFITVYVSKPAMVIFM